VTNAGDKLRPGMFVNVAVVLPQQREVVAVPVTAVIRASYGDSVFCVEPKKGANGAAVNGPDGKPARTARQQFVRIGEMRGDFIAITDGLPAGQEVVTAGAFKLRNNAAIAVNNQVKATPALAPRPANR
jgi:membrane fusion protein (multidrug efflux system)